MKNLSKKIDVNFSNNYFRFFYSFTEITQVIIEALITFNCSYLGEKWL